MLSYGETVEWERPYRFAHSIFPARRLRGRQCFLITSLASASWNFKVSTHWTTCRLSISFLALPISGACFQSHCELIIAVPAPLWRTGSMLIEIQPSLSWGLQAMCLEDGPSLSVDQQLRGLQQLQALGHCFASLTCETVFFWCFQYLFSYVVACVYSIVRSWQILLSLHALPSLACLLDKSTVDSKYFPHLSMSLEQLRGCLYVVLLGYPLFLQAASPVRTGTEKYQE